MLSYGINEEYITSSKYLFSMLYYIKEDDYTLLYNVSRNESYDTRNFENKLFHDVKSEESYYKNLSKPLDVRYFNKYLSKDYIESNTIKLFELFLVSCYLHDTENKNLLCLKKSITYFMENDVNHALATLKTNYKNEDYFLSLALQNSKKRIEAMGLTSESTKYRDLSLRDFVQKFACNGSFDMWPEVLNYLRLSMYENRKIDLTGISSFWWMYQKRKDDTVSSIDVALTVFETNNFINVLDSCKIIKYVQSMSEKGIRYLFNSYIELHDTSIIKTIEQNFELEDLQIYWFDLPTRYINSFTGNVFNFAIDELIRYNSYSQSISFKDIENCLQSNRWEELVRIFKSVGFTITLSDSHPFIDELKKSKIELKIGHNNDDKSKYKKDSRKRYEEGFLSSEDIDFIKKKQLPATEVAKYLDGYYSVLADLDIYRIYNKEEVKENIKTIIYNAFISTTNKLNLFGNLSSVVGNLPKMVDNYEIEMDKEELYNSFMTFLEISLLINKN